MTEEDESSATNQACCTAFRGRPGRSYGIEEEEKEEKEKWEKETEWKEKEKEEHDEEEG